MPNVKHQYDEKGNHRIVVDDKIGEWEHYQGIAELIVGDKYYTATTDYFGEVVRVSSIPKNIGATIESVCRDCNEVYTWDDKTGEITNGCKHVRKHAQDLTDLLNRQFKA